MIPSGDVVETGNVEPSWNKKKNGSAYQLNVVCSSDGKMGTEVRIEGASRKHQSIMHVHSCSCRQTRSGQARGRAKRTRGLYDDMALCEASTIRRAGRRCT